MEFAGKLGQDRFNMASEIVSTEPATGAILWRREIGDVDAEVAMARASWAEWAARPLAYRIETLRRFANVVRAKADAFADLIARETGKPLWESRTEVEIGDRPGRYLGDGLCRTHRAAPARRADGIAHGAAAQAARRAGGAGPV